MPALESSSLKVVVNDEYAPDVKDLTATLTKIKQAAPDAVLMLCYPPDGVLYLKGARELGIVSPFQFAFGRSGGPLLRKDVRAEPRRHRHYGPLVAVPGQMAEGASVL
jgi:ABC-type branched-chain amino acid transport systems, periplasmic component